MRDCFCVYGVRHNTETYGRVLLDLKVSTLSEGKFDQSILGLILRIVFDVKHASNNGSRLNFVE